MLFRRWRSRFIAVTVIGFLTLLLTISLGMRVIAQQNSTSTASQNPNLSRHFKELGLSGSIVIYDSNNNQTYEHNPQRNATEMIPASTFKIFNAMVALEIGVIPDDVTVLTWDGIHRQIEAWNRDTNLRQGFKNSTVWFYQVLARRAGRDRIQEYIDKVGYGNRQIGTDRDIDRFWLQGPLKITPNAQIQFLQRLYRNDLPFSQRTMDLVKDIAIVEQTPEYTLRGKTGWLTGTKPELGWFVGYLEQNKNVYFFATTLDLLQPSDAPARIEITRRSLKDLGLL